MMKLFLFFLKRNAHGAFIFVDQDGNELDQSEILDRTFEDEESDETVTIDDAQEKKKLFFISFFIVICIYIASNFFNFKI
jgi:hypothetical protein